jgi:energy-coupling factor transporter ATP-binding protein EcfA2
MSAVPAIEIRGLSFAYGVDGDAGFSLLGIDHTFHSGTISVVIGPSGCGKTTLLRCIAGIIPSIMKGAIYGSVVLNGRVALGGAPDSIAGGGAPVAPSAPANARAGALPDGVRATPSRAIMKPNEISLIAGLVMQEPDHQIVMTTVEDDIAFGPENRMSPPGVIRRLVDMSSNTVNLSGRLLDAPRTLSGGGKQRLAIAGAIASEPSILLFDEPLSGLDGGGRAMFAGLVRDLKKSGRTIVIVEHDYEELSFADEWILMKGGEVIRAASPDEIDPDLLEGELWR